MKENKRKATFTCGGCLEEIPIDQLHEFDGRNLCPECFREETAVCSVCGERIWSYDNAGTAETPLCKRCYDNYYTSCDRCGALIRLEAACYAPDDEDEEYPMCQSCYTRMERDNAIQDYYYKPAPNFFGAGTRFFGVELEIDEAGESDRKAWELLNIANGEGEKRLYCKHDGSLSDGFELVTHPMSLNYHTEQMPWEKLLHRAVEMGYTSHQAGTCGLHVHVSRAAFGKTEAEQDTAIARVLYFFEKNWEELLKFSRRTQRQLDRWAARYGYKEQPRDILEHAKKGCHAGRYTCVNLQNRSTIEFRIFRGTLKYNTFLATLQMVDRICDVAIFLSDEEIKAMPWSTFVAGCQAPELIQYLKERRLYVNDVISAEEEI